MLALLPGAAPSHPAPPCQPAALAFEIALLPLTPPALPFLPAVPLLIDAHGFPAAFVLPADLPFPVAVADLAEEQGQCTEALRFHAALPVPVALPLLLTVLPHLLLLLLIWFKTGRAVGVARPTCTLSQGKPTGPMQGLKAIGGSEPVQNCTATAGKGPLQQVGCVRGGWLLPCQSLVVVWC